MGSALADVEFLARSEARVAVLDAIHEAPRTRDELKDLAPASRTTLSRMLSDFEDRGWIDRTNGRYEPTPEGRFVASEVSRLLDNLETATGLDEALDWLPTGRFDFDLHRLRDAETFTLGWNDPASMRLLAERLSGASQVQSSAPGGVSREVVDMLHELTVDKGGRYVGILGSSAVTTVRDHPALRRQIREILETGRAEMYRSDGDEPLAMVMVIDDQTAICNHHTEGPQMEAILTDDGRVRSWATGYIDSLRDEATRISTDSFAE